MARNDRTTRQDERGAARPRGERSKAEPLAKADFEKHAAFRYALRQFLTHSEDAARTAGITPQQYQALLAIKGHPDKDELTVGELAERLQLRHHSVVELADRMEAQGLLSRTPDQSDRRQVLLSLTVKGNGCVAEIMTRNREKLREVQPQLLDLLESLVTER